MSREPSIQTEDDLVWRANDVEKSLLHNEMNGPQESDEISRWSRLRRWAVYLVTSICFGALLSLAIYARSQSRVEYGTSSSQDKNWSMIFPRHRTRVRHAEVLCLVESTGLREAVSGSDTTVRFHGTFDRSSPYKGPPSPEVDALWHQVTGCKSCFALLEDRSVDIFK